MKGLLTHGWERIPLGCDGTAAQIRWATLVARWLDKPQPICNGRWVWGFHTLPGRIDPGGLFLRPRVV